MDELPMDELPMDELPMFEMPVANELPLNYEYVQDNITGNITGNINYEPLWVNNMSSCSMIDNMNPTQNTDIVDILRIKEELLSELTETNVADIDVDISSHEKSIKECITKVKATLDIFNEEQVKLIGAEKKYKDSYEQLLLDSDKIRDFGNFVVKIDSKYKDFEATKMNETILDMSRKIKENNNCAQFKEEYQVQNYIFQYYLHNLIKPLNGGNLGSTCNLCLQRQVDTYLQPCGHTGCSECIEKLKERMGEYNCNCFICRRKIIQFSPLYFT